MKSEKRSLLRKGVMGLSIICASLVLVGMSPAQAKGPVTIPGVQIERKHGTLTEARINAVLKENNAGAINFGENSWHFYPSWEHLLEGKTLADNGWPFMAHGKRRVIYDPKALPVSADLMNRTLVYPIPVLMSPERLQEMIDALAKAAKL